MAVTKRHVTIEDIGISRGTARTVYVSWKFTPPSKSDKKKDISKTATLDHYEVQWTYGIGDGHKYEGTTQTIASNFVIASYDPPENAIHVWVRIKPVSKTYKDGDKNVNYWTGAFDDWTLFNIKNETSYPTRKVTIKTLGPSVTGPREIYVTWDFDPPSVSNLGDRISNPNSTVEGYEVEWKYTYGDEDEDGDRIYTIVSATTVPANQKNAYYSADENVKKVACRVKPISKKNVDEEYWTGAYSGWKYYTIVLPSAQKGGKLTVESPEIDPDTGELYVTWSWSAPFILADSTAILNGVDGSSQNTTDHYEFEWQYQTHTGIWYEGSSGNATLSNTTWSAPESASVVRFRVKPISNTHMVNGYETEWWVHDYSSWKEFLMPVDKKFKPAAISGMNISIVAGGDKVTPTGVISTQDELKVEIENIADHRSDENEDGNTDRIEIEVVMENAAIFYTNTYHIWKFHSISASIPVNLGYSYTVRARGVRDKDPNTGTVGYGDWSEYSSAYKARPTAPDLVSVKNESEGQVKVTWSRFGGGGGTNITIYYGDEDTPYDEPSGSKTVAKAMLNAVITGLDTSGKKWWFIGAAVNDTGETRAEKPLWITLGTTPTAPTVWTDNYVIAYSTLYSNTWEFPIYWTHNSEDNSYASESELVLQVFTGNSDVHAARQVILTANEANMRDDQYSYIIRSSLFTDSINFNDYPSVTVAFDIRTTSSASGKTGPRSATQSVKVYKQPRIFLNMYKNGVEEPYLVGDNVTQYPLYVGVTEEDVGQTPINMSLTLITLDTYDGINNLGETVWVNEGDQIFQTIQEYAQKEDNGEIFRYVLLPNNAPMKDGMKYRLSCTVTYNSGLSSTNDRVFTVSLESINYFPNAQVSYNQNDISTIISPYVYDNSGNLVEDVILSVYRLAFDGTFDAVAQNIENLDHTSVSDPHPTLNRVTYRVVAMSYANGSISYADLPAYPIPEKAVVLQWDSVTRSVNDSVEENKLASPLLTTSMLKLPYNIDISENSSPDVAFVEYIGREHPVGYYGTQVGQSLSISSDVDATDSETIDALRRLSRYMGDVYVRTPNGIGYWANITVSFSTNHTELVIPVTLTVTRVEGGV